MTSNHQRTRRLLFNDVFFLGFTLIGAQIIMIRELLLQFNGNELVIGILFTLWMLLTAAGAWTGRYFKIKHEYPFLIRFLLVLISLYPLLAVFSMAYFRNDLFVYGRTISLYETILYTCIILAPICFSGGFVFTTINKSLARVGGRIQNLYAIESFGSLVGGIIISLYFIYMLKVDNFKSLTYLMLINLLYFGISDFRSGKQMRCYIFLLVAIGTMFFIYYFDPGFVARKNLFFGHEIEFTSETPFGNITITRTADQLNFYENGTLLFAEGNVVQREEDVHYAMLQNPEAEDVLLIGGGITGTVKEVLKYPKIKNISYVEINPEIISLFGTMDESLISSVLQTYTVDPLTFVRQTRKRFDIILVNLPSPVNAQLNRYFSYEFYKLTREILKPNGVFSTRLTASSNYLDKHEVKLQASIYNALKQVYSYQLIVPGNRVYFLAGNNLLQYDFLQNFELYKPKNDYVNSGYLNDALLKFRGEQILDSYIDHRIVNHNYKSAVYLSYIQHWMSYYGNVYWIIPAICMVFVLFFLVFSRSYGTLMFTSGFTGSGTEIVLLIVFQVLVGYVYLFLGVVISVFMAGLMVGVFLSQRIENDKVSIYSYYNQVLTGMIILLIAMLIHHLQHHSNREVIQYFVSISTLLIAVLVGFQYGLSLEGTKSETGKKVSIIYSADLFGSATGSLLVSILLIPLLGIEFTLYCFAGLHALSLIIHFIKSKFSYL